MNKNCGKLYVVGTPIGNLGDMSPRGVSVLGIVDFIAAEDTRVSIKLLNHYGIKKPIISYFEHNMHYRGQDIIDRILSGESCAIVTDAGMPCISDPGEELVRQCAENGIETIVVPGPSAVIAAVALSGISSGRFSFEGFLSVKKTSRFLHLEEIKNDKRTLVFYEAPHKLIATLKDMLLVLGDRKIALVREITKLHEEVIRTKLSEVQDLYTEKAPRGEFVIVIEGANKLDNSELIEEISIDDAVSLVAKLVKNGLGVSAASKEIAKQTGHKKGDLYKAYSVCVTDD